MTRDQVIRLLIEWGVARNYADAADQLDDVGSPDYDDYEY